MSDVKRSNAIPTMDGMHGMSKLSIAGQDIAKGLHQAEAIKPPSSKETTTRTVVRPKSK